MPDSVPPRGIAAWLPEPLPTEPRIPRRLGEMMRFYRGLRQNRHFFCYTLTSPEPAAAFDIDAPEAV